MLSITRQLKPATELPLTLTEAEEHCRLDQGQDSDYLTSLIRAVAGLFEHESKIALMATDYLTVFSGWSGKLTGLKYPIVADSIAINYSGASIPDAVLPTTLYTTSQIYPDTLYMLGQMPALLRGAPEAIRVTYKAGYESAADVPEMYKAWLKLVLLHFYENRQPSLIGVNMQEVPMSAKWIMNTIRIPSL
jgi:uncharacterized phiE125 gp8 family phage protein